MARTKKTPSTIFTHAIEISTKGNSNNNDKTNNELKKNNKSKRQEVGLVEKKGTIDNNKLEIIDNESKLHDKNGGKQDNVIHIDNEELNDKEQSINEVG